MCDSWDILCPLILQVQENIISFTISFSFHLVFEAFNHWTTNCWIAQFGTWQLNWTERNFELVSMLDELQFALTEL